MCYIYFQRYNYIIFKVQQLVLVNNGTQHIKVYTKHTLVYIMNIIATILLPTLKNALIMSPFVDSIRKMSISFVYLLTYLLIRGLGLVDQMPVLLHASTETGFGLHSSIVPDRVPFLPHPCRYYLSILFLDVLFF